MSRNGGGGCGLWYQAVLNSANRYNKRTNMHSFNIKKYMKFHMVRKITAQIVHGILVVNFITAIILPKSWYEIYMLTLALWMRHFHRSLS